jgi:hypothetical protein
MMLLYPAMATSAKMADVDNKRIPKVRMLNEVMNAK